MVSYQKRNTISSILIIDCGKYKRYYLSNEDLTFSSMLLFWKENKRYRENCNFSLWYNVTECRFCSSSNWTHFEISLKPFWNISNVLLKYFDSAFSLLVRTSRDFHEHKVEVLNSKKAFSKIILLEFFLLLSGYQHIKKSEA
jgi:hypothetical protein